MVRQCSVHWLLAGLLGLYFAACGGKAHSSRSSADGIAVPDASGSGGAGAADPLAQQGGAGGAATAVGAAGFASGGDAGSSAGAAGASPDITVPTPSPCVFDADVEGGLQRCTNGLLHRPAAVSCPSLLPLPDLVPVAENYPADAGYPFECRRDSDCTAQPYGHCSTEGFPFCEYGCVVDSDCPQDQLCSCQPYGGRCIAAACRSDGDCKAGLCGGTTICGKTQFTCQTPYDQCAGDSDCPQPQRCWLRPIDSANPNSFLRRVCFSAECALGTQ